MLCRQRADLLKQTSHWLPCSLNIDIGHWKSIWVGHYLYNPGGYCHGGKVRKSMPYKVTELSQSNSVNIRSQHMAWNKTKDTERETVGGQKIKWQCIHSSFSVQTWIIWPRLLSFFQFHLKLSCALWNTVFLCCILNIQQLFSYSQCTVSYFQLVIWLHAMT